MPSVYLIRHSQASLQRARSGISGMAGWYACGGGEQVREAPAAIAALRPDFIACDLRLLDGPASRLGYAMRHWPQRPPLLLLAPTADDPLLFEALRAGADNHCIDSGGGQGLLGGLRQLAAGRASMSPLLARQTLEAFGLPRSGLGAAASLPAAQDLTPVGHGLSRAEQHLLSLVGMGLLGREIGERWLLEPGEVEQRLALVHRKLHALARQPRPQPQAAGGAVSTKLGRTASFS